MFTMTEYLEAKPSFQEELTALADRVLTHQEDEDLSLILAFFAHGDVEFYASNGVETTKRPGFCTYCGSEFERTNSVEEFCKPCTKAYFESLKNGMEENDLPF